MLNIGTTEHGDDLVMDLKTLTTHVAVLGATGSGKSGLITKIVEELYEHFVPVILVDIKGDMVNVLDTTLAIRSVLLTPGGTHGEGINILSNLYTPSKNTKAVSRLLDLINEDPNPLTSSAHAYLSKVIHEVAQDTYLSGGMKELIAECQFPSFEYVGGLEVKVAFSARNKNDLARKLNLLYINRDFAKLSSGDDLNIPSLLNMNGISVYSVAHLSEKDQLNAIAYLAEEVKDYVLNQSGCTNLRAVLVIDECIGLLPPTANPPTKEPLMKLLKQGRAFGFGCILGTQNPVDIDYKALSNCGTWFVGRMSATRDISKVKVGLAAMSGASTVTMTAMVAGLGKREFIAASYDSVGKFRSKDTQCKLTGPVTTQEYLAMYEEGKIGFLPSKEPPIEVLPPPNKEGPKSRLTLKESAVLVTILALFGYSFIKLFQVLADML